MKIGRVYKIIAGQSNECNVKSTFNQLKYRFRTHECECYANRACSVKILFDKYGVENCKMILIKEYEVVDRFHLDVYEALWIKKLKSINEKEPCGRLLRSQYSDLYNKKYKLENKEAIKQYNSEYQQIKQ